MPTLINDPDINFDFVRQVNFNRQVNRFLNTDLLGLSGPVQVSSGVLYGNSQSYDFGTQELTNCGDIFIESNASDAKLTITDGSCVVKTNALDASFGGIGTTSASDFLIYANSGANASMYFWDSQSAIVPLSSGTVNFGGASNKWANAYFTNMYLNNNSTSTFFELTSGSTTCRFESFGTAAYSGFGTSTAHNLILFTSGASGATVWFDTSKNVYPHNTGTSNGTVAAPWENIRGNNYNPEGGQFNFGASASGASVLEIGNSSSSGQVAAIDMNFGTSSAVDYNFRIINDADQVLNFVNRTGSSILKLLSTYSYISNQLSVGTTDNVDASIEMCIDGSTIGYPLLMQQYGNSSLNIVARGARGTSGTPTAIQSGDSISTWEARGHDGSSFTSSARGLWRFLASQTWTGSAHGTQFSIGITPNDTTTIATAVIIGNDGDMTLGGTEKTGTYDIYAANYFQNASIGNLTKTKVISVTQSGGGGTVELAAPANTSTQDIDLGDLLPAFAQLVDIQARNTVQSTTSGTITDVTIGMGSSSGATDLSTSSTVFNLNAINESATGSGRLLASNASSRHLFGRFNVTGDNWNTLSAFTIKIAITYTDTAAL